MNSEDPVKDIILGIIFVFIILCLNVLDVKIDRVKKELEKKK